LAVSNGNELPFLAHRFTLLWRSELPQIVKIFLLFWNRLRKMDEKPFLSETIKGRYRGFAGIEDLSGGLRGRVAGSLTA
jgi:hypothetical protein